VYSREPPYDPLIDSTVRVEAARLRRKLKEYYAGEGRLNPVAITLPTGGYVPAFVANRARAPRGDDEAAAATWRHGAVRRSPSCRSASSPATQRMSLFAQTLSDELMVGLAGLPGLRSLSHVTAQQSKDRTDSQAVSAGDLGVDALLRGALCRSGGVVGVTVELCDQRGLVLWTERFVAPRLDGAALRRWICAAVLGRVRFDGCSGPHAVETLATILRARQLLDEQTPGALRVALQLFSSICRSAPDYARGHAGVADAYCDLYRLGLGSRAMALGAAKPAALRALQIDPQSIEAHVALATVSCWLERGGWRPRPIRQGVGLARMHAGAPGRKAPDPGRTPRRGRRDVLRRSSLELHPCTRKSSRRGASTTPAATETSSLRGVTRTRVRVLSKPCSTARSPWSSQVSTTQRAPSSPKSGRPPASVPT
jgi:TolB-like protein